MAVLLIGFLLAGCALPPEPTAQVRAAVPPPPPHLLPGAIASHVHRAINRARVAHGASPLSYDPALETIALRHSADMARGGYFSHPDRRGKRVDGRARDVRYRYRHLGENLFKGTLYSQFTTRTVAGRADVLYRWYTPAELAEEVVARWLESPGHRSNLLAHRYTHQGIGVAYGPEAAVLVTQNLSEPR